jgi:hypothetical protein
MKHDKNKRYWWGYLHSNDTIQVKPWYGDVKDYTDDCIGNPFVKQVVEPFEAENREEAYMIIERELDGTITGSGE